MARRPDPVRANGAFSSVAELAEYFVVGMQTNRSRIKDGAMALQYAPFGKHIRFDPAETQAWIDVRWHTVAQTGGLRPESRDVYECADPAEIPLITVTGAGEESNNDNPHVVTITFPTTGTPNPQHEGETP